MHTFHICNYNYTFTKSIPFLKYIHILTYKILRTKELRYDDLSP